MSGNFIIAAKAIVGTVPELPEYLRKPLRRGDQFILLTATAVHKALTQVATFERPGDRCGLFLGTCFGPMQSNFNVLDTLIDDDPVSPTLFSHSVFNAAAGYVSRLYGIFGGAWTLTSFSWPFLHCLEDALFMLDSGRLDRAVVLQVETYAPLLHDAVQQLNPGNDKQWPCCAVAWILDRTTPDPRKLSLAKASIVDRASDPKSYLDRGELLAGDPDAPLDLDPMALPLLLTDLAVKTCWQGEKQISVTARFGRAEITLCAETTPPVSSPNSHCRI